MGSKLDQVPSIFFHKDPCSSICVVNPSLAEVQVPIFIDQAPTFFGHAGELPPHFKISRINTVFMHSRKTRSTSYIAHFLSEINEAQSRWKNGKFTTFYRLQTYIFILCHVSFSLLFTI